MDSGAALALKTIFICAREPSVGESGFRVFPICPPLICGLPCRTRLAEMRPALRVAKCERVAAALLRLVQLLQSVVLRRGRRQPHRSRQVRHFIVTAVRRRKQCRMLAPTSRLLSFYRRRREGWMLYDGRKPPGYRFVIVRADSAAPSITILLRYSSSSTQLGSKVTERQYWEQSIAAGRTGRWWRQHNPHKGSPSRSLIGP